MKRIPSFKYLFGIIDLLVLFVSFGFAGYFLRSETSLNLIQLYAEHTSYLLLFLLLSLIYIVVFQYNSLYKINILITRAAHLAQIIKAMYYGALNIVLVSLFFEHYEVLDLRFLVFVFILVAIPLLYLTRIELIRALFLGFSNSRFKRNVVIIGNGESGKLLATKLVYENPIGLNIVGFIDDEKPVSSDVVIGKKVLGRIEQLGSFVKDYDVDEIIVNVDGDDTEKTLALIDYCKAQCSNVKVTSELFNIVARKMNTEKYIDVPVVDVSAHYNNKMTILLKRAFDVLISLIALILLSPLMIFIALFIKASSSGPVLFNQIRIGKYGKEFKFYKFRSMRGSDKADSERVKQMINFMKDESLKTKIINDSRVTWIGKILRQTSLDELPQLFNVLKGEMSLVGPRPCLPYEYENYDEWQKRRVNVIPGCTGVWQVWGRSSVSFKESVVLDLYYMNNMSPWFDLQLLFQTIPAILTARGAK